MEEDEESLRTDRWESNHGGMWEAPRGNSQTSWRLEATETHLVDLPASASTQPLDKPPESPHGEHCLGN